MGTWGLDFLCVIQRSLLYQEYTHITKLLRNTLVQGQPESL